MVGGHLRHVEGRAGCHVDGVDGCHVDGLRALVTLSTSGPSCSSYSNRREFHSRPQTPTPQPGPSKLQGQQIRARDTPRTCDLGRTALDADDAWLGDGDDDLCLTHAVFGGFGDLFGDFGPRAAETTSEMEEVRSAYARRLSDICTRPRSHRIIAETVVKHREIARDCISAYLGRGVEGGGACPNERRHVGVDVVRDLRLSDDYMRAR